VFVIAVDGSRETRVVSDLADDRVAGWSPDGRHLLFTSTRTGSRSLWAVPVTDGRAQAQPDLVKTDVGGHFSLGVTRDGALYLHRYASSRDIKIAPIDLAAGRLTGPISHFSRGLLPVPSAPHWSPDGKELAYQVRGDEEGLAIRRVATGEVRKLRHLRYSPEPRWSPDGRWLLVGSRDATGRAGILRIDAASGKASLIVHTEGLGASPRWSVDGQKIYYIGRRPFGDSMSLRERDLATGRERDLLTRPSIGTFEVSPDGQWIAFRVNKFSAPSSTAIWIVPTTGGGARELVGFSAAESIMNAWGQIAWSLDSRQILTARRREKTTELLLVDIESKRQRALDIDISAWTVGQAGPAGGYSLSPDGKSIAFLMGRSAAEVWAMENFLPAARGSRR
jgi:Tol biopolymer transport system component